MMPIFRRLRGWARALGIPTGSRGDLMARLIDEADRESDTLQQYERRFATLQQLARAWGFEIYNRSLAWMNETEFHHTMERFPLGGQRLDRKFVLWSLAKSVRELTGDTAECGVLHGHSSHLICSVMQDDPTHQHHIFDSFEGLSEPLPADAPQVDTAYQWNEGDLSVSEEEVRKNLRGFEFVHYYPGWIPERFPEVEETQFKFVHVDVDLYQPTLDSLAFFFPRMVAGGILLCDDYGSEICPGARKAFDQIGEQFGMSVVHLPTGQGLVTKR